MRSVVYRWAGAAAIAASAGCREAPTQPEMDRTEVTSHTPVPWHTIAFVGNGNGYGPNLFRVRWDGSDLTQVGNVTFQDLYVSWQPWTTNTPHHLAFGQTWEPNGLFIYHPSVIRLDGTILLDLTPGSETGGGPPVWSPDGLRLAFTRGDIGEHLVVVNWDGTGLDTIVSTPKIHVPAWGPDGQRLAYFVDQDVPGTFLNERGIWRVNADGTGKAKIRSAADGVFYLGLQYSPDGQKLALCQVQSGVGTLQVMNAEGGGVVSLPAGCGPIWYDGPQWSPDGTRLLTLHKYDLHTLAPNGSNLTAVTTEGTQARQVHWGRWSRQGHRIAYVHLVDNWFTSTTDNALFIRLPDGSGKQRLTPNGMQVSSPSWGP